MLEDPQCWYDCLGLCIATGARWGVGTRRSGFAGGAAEAVAATGRAGHQYQQQQQSEQYHQQTHHPHYHQHQQQQQGGDVWSTKATGLRDVEDRCVGFHEIISLSWAQ